MVIPSSVTAVPWSVTVSPTKPLDGFHDLSHRRHRPFRHKPHLLEPERQTQADGRPETAGERPPDSRRLHRQDRRVAGHGRHEAGADRDLFSCAKRERRPHLRGKVKAILGDSDV